MSKGNWWGRGKVKTTSAFTADPAVVAEAEALDIDQNEIDDGGGWRNDETKKVHWLRLRQLVEYTKADLRIEDNQEFWDWFADFRKTENIGQSRGAVSYGSYSGGWVSQSKDYLSDWWKGWGYGGSADKDRKLAVALSAASATVGVINDTGTNYHVKFSQQGESSTDLDKRTIVISPEAVLDKNIEDDRAIRITTGLALHEGSHTKYTPSVAKVLEQPTELTPVQISQLLLNLLEDLRIERLTADKFPGFASYFTDIREWGWDTQKDKAPTKWGPDLRHKLGSVILSTKWASDYESIARADPELSAQLDWWKAWGETYRDAPSNDTARQLVEDGLARLREDPNTAKELDAMAEKEKAIRDAMKQPGKPLTDAEFEEFLAELKKQLGNPSDFEACPSPDHAQGIPVQLSSEQAQQVQKLVSEKMEIHFSQFPDAATGAAPKIIVTRPQETEHSKRAYRVPDRNLVQRIKGAFFLRKRKPTFDERLLKRGLVDDEALWRVADDDFRVFLQRQVEEQDFIAATMLIDCSGSMHGGNLARAQMLASVLLECFSTMPNARVKVRGHAYTGGDACNVYRIWEPGDPRTRLGLFEFVDSGSNYDGYAIEYCATEMLKDARPNETKLLIVLSDGRPNGGLQYRGMPAMKHVRRVTDAFGRKDIALFQIAVDSAVTSTDQSTMFANWIPFDAHQLPMKLGRLLIKMFGAQQ